MQKLIHCHPDDNTDPEISLFDDVNVYLDDGWKVVSITPQICSIAGGGQSSYIESLFGGFVVVIEKDENINL